MELSILAEEDGSLTFEFIEEEFRVFLSLEQKDEDSGWGFVSKESMGNKFETNALTKEQLKTIYEWMRDNPTHTDRGKS